MKPVLLLYPPYEGRMMLKSRAPFPIGPLSIAAYLEAHGVKAEVVDCGYPPERSKVSKPIAMKVSQQYVRYGWTDTEITKWLKANLKKYHSVVGVASLMSSNYAGGYRVAELIKKVDKERVVVMGGPHATAFSDHVAIKSVVDWICIGEGEHSFLMFLLGKKAEGMYTTKFVRFAALKGKPLLTRRAFIREMDTLPFPDRSLLKDDRDTKELMVAFSRGCPHKCSFCGSFLIQGRAWRRKTIARVVDELSFFYHDWGARKFLVEDDNLCPGPKGIRWLKGVCRRIIEKLPKIRLTVPHGIPVYATADKELTELMWEAGFRNMVFPLESTDPAVLEHMNKEFTPDNWRLGINNWHYEKKRPTEIILGYPFVETIETMLRTMIDISEEKGAVWASHFRLNKGTPLFKKCLEAGYVGRDYDPINTQSFFIETERFTVKDLKELMRISRGINFGTERGFDVFRDDPFKAEFRDYRFLGLQDVSARVAIGKFKFKRAQDTFTRLLLLRTGAVGDMKAVLRFLPPKHDSIAYYKNESSKVYQILYRLLSAEGLAEPIKEKGIKAFMGK
jgi:hypothetical protein